MSRRRVGITGLGLISSLGHDVAQAHAALCAGTSGISPISNWDASTFPVRIAGEIKGWNPELWIPKKDANRLDPFAQYAVAAAAIAIADSKLDLGRENLDRIGSIVGFGIGGLQIFEEQYKRLLDKGPDKCSPFFIPKMMMNAAAGQISIRWGLRGTSFATASACASANHALGQALRTIQYGDADVVVTGGTEATVTPSGMAGFIALRALSERNAEPQRASRPFDKDRDGFVMGEGAGILIFEELEHARKRGARIYAEVVGFGSTADAHHITAPIEDGSGASRAMTLALADAKVAPEGVQYVNAHGTATPLNDPIETRAVKGTFGDHAKRLAISSTKSMLGHLLGASGAVEGLVTAYSIYKGRVHPTANLETPDPQCDLDYVPLRARDLKIRCALSNSFGFGGHNTSIAFAYAEN